MAKTKTLLKVVGTALIVALVATVTTVSLLGSSQESEALVAENGGVLQFTSAGYTVSEDGVSVDILVERVESSEGAVSVYYYTKDGDAIAGEDYVASEGVLNWVDGDKKAKIITVEILDNQVKEGDKHFTVALDKPVNAKLGSPIVAKIAILENEPAAGTFVLGAESFELNEGEKMKIAVKRLGGSEGDVVVKYKIQKNKDVASPFKGELFWKKGDSTDKFIEVATEEDGLVKYRSLTVELKKVAKGAAIGDPGMATVHIIDPKFGGFLDFSEPAYSVNEEGEAVFVTVDRLFGTAGTVSASYVTTSGTALEGKDFELTKGKLEWLRGDNTSKTFKVNILDDNEVELLETFSISLTGSDGEILGYAEVNIVDNDVK